MFFVLAVISCGVLSTPSNGRKSTFAFTPGTMVKFDCDPGYVLTGERRRWCYESGDWNWAENGEAYCMRKYQNHQKSKGNALHCMLQHIPVVKTPTNN